MADLKGLLRSEDPGIQERIRTHQSELTRHTPTHRDPKIQINLSQLAQMAGTLTYCLANEVEALSLAFRVSFERGNIINVPGDGNCLYHAFIIGLFFYNRTIPATFSHLQLREVVVGWLRTELAKPIEIRDPFVGAYLEMSIADYQDSRKQQIRDQLTNLRSMIEGGDFSVTTDFGRLQEELDALETEEISAETHAEAYLALASQPGFLGSSAELFALGKLYPDIRIVVSSGAPPVTRIEINPDQEQTINLVLDSAHYRILIEPATVREVRRGTGSSAAAAPAAAGPDS